MLFHFSGGGGGAVLEFITAKLFHKLEIEIENDGSFSFLKLVVGLCTMLQ